MKTESKLFKAIRPFLSAGWLLTFIIIIGAALRFYQIGKLSFWGDEIDSYNFAKLGLCTMFNADATMSLFYAILHFWLILFPNASDGTLRALPAIFSIAGIPVVYFIGVQMVSNPKQAKAIGLTAALLVSVNAYSIQYAQELRSYSLVFLLTALSSLLLIKAVERQGFSFWWLGYVVIGSASVYSHFLAIFLLTAQAISLLMLKSRKVLWAEIAIAVLIIPDAIAVAAKGVGQIAWIPRTKMQDIFSLMIKLAGNNGHALLYLCLIAAGIGILIGAGVWLKRDPAVRWKFMLVASCFFIPVVLILAVSQFIPDLVSRYLLYTMPYLVILTAVGIVILATLGNNRVFRFVTISIGVIFLVTVVWYSLSGDKRYFIKSEKMDYRGITALMTQECGTSLRLFNTQPIEKYVVYYNTNLASQTMLWRWDSKQSMWVLNDQFDENHNFGELAVFLPSGYNSACLLTGTPTSLTDQVQLTIIREAILTRFPEEVSTQVFGDKLLGYLRLEIYSRRVFYANK